MKDGQNANWSCEVWRLTHRPLPRSRRRDIVIRLLDEHFAIAFCSLTLFEKEMLGSLSPRLVVETISVAKDECQSIDRED